MKMCRFRFSLAMISFLLLTTIISACQPIQPVAEAQAMDDDTTFGSNVAGTYLVDAQEHGANELRYKMLATFTADGSIIAELTLDFGANHPPRFKSAEHGSWVRTGERELAITMFAFDYGLEESHESFGPQNVHIDTVRIVGTISFDEDFENYVEKTVVEILGADKDPLDPTAEPLFPSFPGERVGRRIPAIMDGNGQ